MCKSANGRRKREFSHLSLFPTFAKCVGGGRVFYYLILLTTPWLRHCSHIKIQCVHSRSMLGFLTFRRNLLDLYLYVLYRYMLRSLLCMYLLARCYTIRDGTGKPRDAPIWTTKRRKKPTRKGGNYAVSPSSPLGRSRSTPTSSRRWYI